MATDSDCEFDAVLNSYHEERKGLIGEKCGIFGCIANGEWPTTLDVANIIHLGLVGLQHRGQESAGIVTCTTMDESFATHRGHGLVSQVFSEPIMLNLKGNVGIGHTRYSTMGGSDGHAVIQPFIVHTSCGTIATAHNGELINSKKLRKQIMENGVGLSTGTDSELITQILSSTPPKKFLDDLKNSHNVMANGHHDTEEEFLSRLVYLMSLTPLSYSLIVLYNECIYALRDPFGNRPLCIGKLVTSHTENDLKPSIEKIYVEGWIVSSESCPFPSVLAHLVRDVLPGEIIKLEKDKEPRTLAKIPRPDNKPAAFCIFEYVYFAKSNSIIEGQQIYEVRYECGKRLAKECPVNGIPDDNSTSKHFIVSAVPESSVPAALGFAKQLNLPFVEVFCKNRYVGRTFIQPSSRLRRQGVALKFSPLRHNFIGKSVILIDDSVVRGTTIAQLVRLLKDNGAKDVHIRIASPPLLHPCNMGIDIPTNTELIANSYKKDQLTQGLAHKLGAASLKYLSVEGLKESIEKGIKNEGPNGCKRESGYCTACLTGDYPVELNF